MMVFELITTCQNKLTYNSYNAGACCAQYH